MADKIKTGIEVTRKDNGETWYCERDRQDGTILLRDTPNKAITATLFDTTLSNITIARKFGKSPQNSLNKPKATKPNEDKEMNSFFVSLYDKMSYLCMECNKPLYAFTNKAKKSACAHILPKSTFESIKMNPKNIMYLGAAYIGQCGCHDIWDSNSGNRKKMKVYKFALGQFEELKVSMTGQELVAAYKYLGIEWANTIEAKQETDLKNIKRHGQSDNRK